MKLIVRLSTIAGAHGHCAVPQANFEGWVANPLIVKSLQTNGYDCGVWVLAGIWAVLRGHEVTSHTEASISRVRSAILTAILDLPDA